MWNGSRCGVCGEMAQRYRDASKDEGVRALLMFFWNLGRLRSVVRSRFGKGDVLKAAEKICPDCFTEFERMLVLNSCKNPLMEKLSTTFGWRPRESNGLAHQVSIKSRIVQGDVCHSPHANRRIVGRLRDCGKHCFSCGKRFSDEMAAARHVGRHSRQVPLSCGYCPGSSKMYSNLDALKKHAMDAHFTPEFVNGSPRRVDGLVDECREIPCSVILHPITAAQIGKLEKPSSSKVSVVNGLQLEKPSSSKEPPVVNGLQLGKPTPPKKTPVVNGFQPDKPPSKKKSPVVNGFHANGVRLAVPRVVLTRPVKRGIDQVGDMAASPPGKRVKRNAGVPARYSFDSGSGKAFDEI